ncbi:MAG: hypothetical protein IJ714_07945 [Bacteroidales bacterium]|nr:hypothetical protein [Bacteroidales bacterium]
MKVYHQTAFLQELVPTLKGLHFYEGTGDKTRELNKKIAHIAQSFGLSVWAKHLSGEDNPDRDDSHISGHEWLYDLICYRFEKEHYALSDTVLVMESEWKKIRYYKKGNDGNDQYGEVKFDFQKLLVSNADIKMLVYQHHKGEVGTDEDLERYFRRRIDNYRQGSTTDLFVFVRYSGESYGKGTCTVSSYTRNGEWKQL